MLQKLGFLEERRDVIMGMSSIVYRLIPETASNQILKINDYRPFQCAYTLATLFRIEER